VHKNLDLGARSWDTAILDQQATATSSWNELHSGYFQTEEGSWELA
ncbi:hypothetical protein L917_01317, partial [Phytophthora nicotianae]